MEEELRARASTVTITTVESVYGRGSCLVEPCDRHTEAVPRTVRSGSLSDQPLPLRRMRERPHHPAERNLCPWGCCRAPTSSRPTQGWLRILLLHFSPGAFNDAAVISVAFCIIFTVVRTSRDSFLLDECMGPSSSCSSISGI